MYELGTLQAKEKSIRINFDTINGLMIVPVTINNDIRSFIFDTGAFATVIKENTIEGKTIAVGGASKREVQMGYKNFPSIKIGSFDFKKTFVVSNELKGLDIRVAGFIGQPIIKRANWLIDYPKRKLTISTENLADSDFRSIKIIREDNAPYTFITIDGTNYKCILDLGSRSTISIPEGTSLAEHMLSTYDFKEIERETWTIGGSKIEKEKIGILTEFKIGGISFENVKVNIKKTSQLRIGLPFFKDYQLYIDNIAGDYKIK